MSENYVLIEEIIARSNNKIWDKAKLEWDLVGITHSEEEKVCLCSHFPIKEICHLQNRETHIAVEIGNCCVKHFFNMDSQNIFDSLRRIKKDINKSLNSDTINYYFKNGFLTQWEYGFYLDIWRKRVLSFKQREIKVRINKKILSVFDKPKQ